MKVEKTYEQLAKIQAIQFNLFGYSVNGNFFPGVQGLDLEAKAIKQFEKFAKKALKSFDFDERVRDLALDNALEDPATGKIIYEANGSYAFSKAGKKALNAATKALLSETVEVHYDIVLEWKDLLAALPENARKSFTFDSEDEVIEALSPFYNF